MANYFNKKTVRDLPLDGQTVLLRADYNVPMHENGTIADDYRVTQSLPTLQYLLNKRRAKLVICSHLGRPEGKRTLKFSLAPIAKRLSELLGRPVRFVDDCVGDKVRVATKNMQPGEVTLLENLRFHPEEEQNNLSFAKSLARDAHARYFVQDGFGVVHRAHASTSAITQCLPSVGGLLIEREYQHILGAVHAPKRPLLTILGGAKIADKLPLIDRFINLADHIVIGGAMANTFLQYKGVNVGKSLVEPDEKTTIDRIYRDAAKKVGSKSVDGFIMLPTDVAVATKIHSMQPRKEVRLNAIHDQEIILDLGIISTKAIEFLIKQAGTVIWNGTLGYAEAPQFMAASQHVAKALARQPDTTSIIGGGDTADFVLDWDKKKGASFTHVSTGGGASLELMSGKKLPGVEALLKA
jgi:phosphoglycerate kinase